MLPHIVIFLYSIIKESYIIGFEGYFNKGGSENGK